MLGKNKNIRIFRYICYGFGIFILTLFVLSEIRTEHYAPLLVKGLDAIKFPLGVVVGIIAAFLSSRALSDEENRKQSERQKAYLSSVALVIRDCLVRVQRKAEKFEIIKNIQNSKNISQLHIRNIKNPDYAFQRISDFLDSCELFCTKFIEFHKNDDVVFLNVNEEKSAIYYGSVDHLVGSIIQKIRSIRQHIGDSQFSKLDDFRKEHVVRAVFVQIPKALCEIEMALRALGNTGPYPEPDPL